MLTLNNKWPIGLLHMQQKTSFRSSDQAFPDVWITYMVLTLNLNEASKGARVIQAKRFKKLNQYYWILHHNYCFLLKEPSENLPNSVSER